MIKKTRKYTEEFKTQALQLARDLGSIPAAGKQLGISEVNIYNWREKQNLNSKSEVMVGESSEEEVRRLRKEVNELRKVNQILKAAAAFFSQDSLK